MRYLVASSMGNDSIALIQFMLDGGYDFSVIYNDTGWARDDWPARVKKCSDWLLEKGVTLHITKSIGMVNIVKKNKGWPMPASSMQWCTEHLKEKPTTELLNKIDADCELVCVTGRRREESANRSSLAEWQEESQKHGGRDVWNPLVRYDAKMRDELISKTPFDVLLHQSMECYPCVCANKDDLKSMQLDEKRIKLIEELEIELGHTRYGKPRTMFRPYRAGYGVGIRQVFQWATEPNFKSSGYPEAYKMAGIDYTGYNMVGLKGKEAKQRYTEFLKGVEAQIKPGAEMSFDFSAHDDAYDIDKKSGLEVARQCDGGYCGN